MFQHTLQIPGMICRRNASRSKREQGAWLHEPSAELCETTANCRRRYARDSWVPARGSQRSWSDEPLTWSLQTPTTADISYTTPHNSTQISSTQLNSTQISST